MALVEINFDGIVGPSHNYAGLSLGNLAATANAGSTAFPRAAALQGVEKMRHNLAARPGAGHLPAAPPARTAPGWPRSAPTSRTRPRRCAPPPSRPRRCGRPMRRPSRPPPTRADGRCHLTVANLRHHGASQPRMAGDAGAAPARLRRRGAISRSTRRCPRTFGDEGAANHMRLCAGHDAAGRRDLRLRRARRRLPGAPACRGVARGRPAAPARSGADPVRPAVRGGDRRRRLPQRRRRGRQRACPVRARAGVRRTRRASTPS